MPGYSSCRRLSSHLHLPSSTNRVHFHDVSIARIGRRHLGPVSNCHTYMADVLNNTHRRMGGKGSPYTSSMIAFSIMARSVELRTGSTSDVRLSLWQRLRIALRKSMQCVIEAGLGLKEGPRRSLLSTNNSITNPSLYALCSFITAHRGVRSRPFNLRSLLSNTCRALVWTLFHGATGVIRCISFITSHVSVITMSSTRLITSLRTRWVSKADNESPLTLPEPVPGRTCANTFPSLDLPAGQWLPEVESKVYKQENCSMKQFNVHDLKSGGTSHVLEAAHVGGLDTSLQREQKTIITDLIRNCIQVFMFITALLSSLVSNLPTLYQFSTVGVAFPSSFCTGLCRRLFNSPFALTRLTLTFVYNTFYVFTIAPILYILDVIDKSRKNYCSSATRGCIVPGPRSAAQRHSPHRLSPSSLAK